uniref:Uncharacterized protein n=1 Tax=Euplotes crassus TaxID=5936 RepID=A0A7S3P0V7_EUPCR|mmetsp:Transcript_3805/g.3551  ORF Transcript_3805/g.3551 Transcript_3805/m.3551 type:complete len:416 (+) Transcript_3805:12-1259(+)|eukprot:CAMPEP_0197003990 /NCGR_PEP_ID=MMETSP1380-20130617/17032_1 /TAXON_ID=5936 /ORGANISM="Euplotes crassus, Strain CT5" /LENGTH=415 /DNA_ID=CAMNT_0042422623 /DNA_START=12 /DNA_END=1259 /DNA_ORIENTATION=-
MGCGGSKAKAGGKPAKGFVEIFSDPNPIASKETADGVVCSTKQGEFTLPGHKKDYDFSSKGGQHYIQVEKKKTKSMISVCNSRIGDQENKKKPLTKDINDKKDKDGSKAAKAKQIDKNISDFKTVRDILRDGGPGKHRMSPQAAKSQAAPKAGAAPLKKTTMKKPELDKIVKEFTDDHYYSIYKERDKLTLNLRSKDDSAGVRQILKKSDKAVLPDLKEIAIWGIEKDDYKDVNEILIHSFPHKIEELHITGVKGEDFGGIIEGMEKAAGSLKGDLRISTFDIGKKELERLFNAYAHIDRIEFSNCTFDTKKIAFDTKKAFKIREMEMVECGDEEHNDWEENTQDFEDFLSAIAKSKLKNSLERFVTEDNGLNADEIEEYFEAAGLDQVEVLTKKEESQEDGSENSSDSDEPSSY